MGRFEPITYYPTTKPKSSSQTHAESSTVCDNSNLNTLNNKLTRSLYLRGKVDDTVEEEEMCILLYTGAESNFISEESAYYLEKFCSCLRSSNSLDNSVQGCARMHSMRIFFIFIFQKSRNVIYSIK